MGHARPMIRAGLLTLLIATTATPAWAQVTLTGDLNGDRRLSFEEFQASRRALMMRSDRDGRIGPAEWVAGETRVRRELQGAGYRDGGMDLGTGGYGKMDADKDRYVSLAELEAYIARRFESLDADKDGVLNPGEFRAAMGDHAR